MRRPLLIPWRWWRRAAQFVLLLVFLWLFRRTEYNGQDQLAGGENIFFRLDPLAGIAAMLGARQIISMFWPAMIVAALTMVLGRFFCGWICPLGTLIDYFHRLFISVPLSLWRRIRGRVPSSKQRRELTSRFALTAHGKAAKYYVLITVLLAAVFAFPLAGLVDPLSLLVRGFVFWGDPMLYRGADACFGWLSNGWVTNTLQPWVKNHMLPFRPAVFQLAGASATMLAIIFALEFVARRFWCRYLCPTGTLFGLLSRRSLLKRVPVKVCKVCGDCAATCRMNALDPIGGLSPQFCTLCMDCVDLCPKSIATFRFTRKTSTSRPRPVDLSRRGVLAGMATGFAIPGAALASRMGVKSSVPSSLLRPPGAADEKTFLNLCIRCGECMKVCPTTVLQPTVFEAGLEGVFSPRLAVRFIFEQTYCEYCCTLCGQVCPTGAIPRLSEEAKHAKPIGKAYFDHNLCLPWAKDTPCVRCEEMCPVPDKAIRILDEVKVIGKDGLEVVIRRPYVDRDLCVGCGICETNCPIEGVAGIRVWRVDAPDPGTEFLINHKQAGEKKGDWKSNDN